ncbi:recombinase family protein [Deinococcus cellulosilyticus]|nr:recombinase family protein [Deinococcus cellulosilyticus]
MSSDSKTPTGPRVGYARVSTRDQNLDSQIDALKAAGCRRIFKDTLTGSKADRPGLGEALNYLREGDTLVVWKLDRLGRSLQNLIETVKLLEARGIHLLVLTEGINTNSANGLLFFHIFGALAEFEREVIRERTHAGLQAARARGRKGGRKPSLSPEKQKMALELLSNPEHRIKDVAQGLGVSERTLFRLRQQMSKDDSET